MNNKIWTTLYILAPIVFVLMAGYSEPDSHSGYSASDQVTIYQGDTPIDESKIEATLWDD